MIYVESKIYIYTPQEGSQHMDSMEAPAAHSQPPTATPCVVSKRVFIPYDRKVAIDIKRFKDAAGRPSPTCPSDVKTATPNTSVSGSQADSQSAENGLQHMATNQHTVDEDASLNNPISNTVNVEARGCKLKSQLGSTGRPRRAFRIVPSKSEMITNPSDVNCCVPVDDAPQECHTHNTRESSSLAISRDLDT